jgi:hypothetical protein
MDELTTCNYKLHVIVLMIYDSGTENRIYEVRNWKDLLLIRLMFSNY